MVAVSMQLAYSSPIFCSLGVRVGARLSRPASRICFRCSRFSSKSSVKRPYEIWSGGSGLRLNQPLQL